MKYYVFDWELGDHYVFDTKEQVDELIESLVDVDEDISREDVLEGIQVIKGEEVEYD